MMKVDLELIRHLKFKMLDKKPPKTPEETEALGFASKIINLITDGKQMTEFWAFYILNSALDGEPELRGKITTVMISALIDTVESEKRVVDKYKAHAEEKGYSNMVAVCDRTKEWCLAAKGVLGLFSKEEQLFIQDMRNSLVHGWLAKKHQERFNIKYFDGEKMVQEEVSRTDYNDMLKVPLLGIRDGDRLYQKGLYDVLTEFSEKFANQNLNYWKIMGIISQDGYMHSLIESVYSDIGVDYPSGPKDIFGIYN